MKSHLLRSTAFVASYMPPAQDDHVTLPSGLSDGDMVTLTRPSGEFERYMVIGTRLVKYVQFKTPAVYGPQAERSAFLPARRSRATARAYWP